MIQSDAALATPASSFDIAQKEEAIEEYTAEIIV